MKPWPGFFLLGAIAFVILAGGFAATRTAYEKPNWEFFADMVHTPAYTAYSQNPVLPGGQTLQAPPPGTIARGFLPEDTSPGGATASESSSETQAVADRERGRVVFARICSPCHGPGGAGDGLVAQRGFPPPPNLATARVAEMTPAEIARLVANGRGNMPSLAEQVAREDRLRVALYVRTKIAAGAAQ